MTTIEKAKIADNSVAINPADALLGKQPKSPVTDHFITAIAADGTGMLQADSMDTLEDPGLTPADRAAVAASLLHQRRTRKP